MILTDRFLKTFPTFIRYNLDLSAFQQTRLIMKINLLWLVQIGASFFSTEMWLQVMRLIWNYNVNQ